MRMNRIIRQSFLSEEQQQDIQQLRDDIAAIRSESEVTPEQIQALKTNIQSLMTDETIPQGGLRDYFATVAEYIDGGLTETEMAELTELTSNQFGLDSETDQAAIDGIIADVQAIVEASNWDTEEVQAVVDDVQAITEELRENTTNTLAERGISLPEIDETGGSRADLLLGEGFSVDALTGGDGNDPLTRFNSITQGDGGLDLFNGETRPTQFLLGDTTALSDSDGVGFGQGILDADVIQNLDLAEGNPIGLNNRFIFRLAGTGISTETEDRQGLMGIVQTLAGGESNFTEGENLV